MFKLAVTAGLAALAAHLVVTAVKDRGITVDSDVGLVVAASVGVLVARLVR